MLGSAGNHKHLIVIVLETSLTRSKRLPNNTLVVDVLLITRCDAVICNKTFSFVTDYFISVYTHEHAMLMLQIHCDIQCIVTYNEAERIVGNTTTTEMPRTCHTGRIKTREHLILQGSMQAVLWGAIRSWQAEREKTACN